MGARRIGMAAVLAIGCLVLTQSLGACSGSTDNRGGGNGGSTDGGTGGSGGGTDGGTGGGGGNVNTDGTTGSTCTAATNGDQGSCQTGFGCETDITGGYCTMPCTAASDCGSGNLCLANTQDGTPQPGTCSGGTTPCWTNADCTGAGATCQNAQPGACFKGCDTTVQAGQCNSGQICMGGVSQTATQGICYPDCRQTANFCGTDVCDQTTGQCKAAPGTQQAYQPCGGTNGNCAANLDCVGTSQNDSRCLQECQQDTDCTDVSGSTCILKASSGSTKWCGVTCTPGGTTNSCPSGSSCQAVTGGGFCF